MCAGASGQHGKVTFLVKEQTAVLRPVFPIVEGLVEDHVRAHENARTPVGIHRFGDPSERHRARDRPRRVIGGSSTFVSLVPPPNVTGRVTVQGESSKASNTFSVAVTSEGCGVSGISARRKRGGIVGRLVGGLG